MIGVDEVGRGSLAGPLLVVAGRAERKLPGGLRDSKLMSRVAREAALTKLINYCSFGEGWVTAVEIDKYGLAQALRLGVARALKSLQASAGEEVIMDGSVNYVPKKFKSASCLINGDNLVPIISAASIYAKVTRDRYMRGIAQKYPDYGFESHVGYGTAVHIAAIKTLGAVDKLHRLSFEPVKSLGAAG